ncbi:MAG: hypothetical protein CL685_01565 [Candidatus Magasanikbacteria bacterium]|nr:hypothetical protein [Candidatus Magasanikbacteria bacterium]|tara:strand:+ start:3271 stop:4536 length:1266 start_codon:yes stop_codon:yes gene_type:complete
MEAEIPKQEFPSKEIGMLNNTTLSDTEPPTSIKPESEDLRNGDIALEELEATLGEHLKIFEQGKQLNSEKIKLKEKGIEINKKYIGSDDTENNIYFKITEDEGKLMVTYYEDDTFDDQNILHELTAESFLEVVPNNFTFQEKSDTKVSTQAVTPSEAAPTPSQTPKKSQKERVIEERRYLHDVNEPRHDIVKGKPDPEILRSIPRTQHPKANQANEKRPPSVKKEANRQVLIEMIDKPNLQALKPAFENFFGILIDEQGNPTTASKEKFNQLRDQGDDSLFTKTYNLLQKMLQNKQATKEDRKKREEEDKGKEEHKRRREEIEKELLYIKNLGNSVENYITHIKAYFGISVDKTGNINWINKRKYNKLSEKDKNLFYFARKRIREINNKTQPIVTSARVTSARIKPKIPFRKKISRFFGGR